MQANEKHWCPICDEGWVEPVRISPSNAQGWLCSECEAFWPNADMATIAREPFVQFSLWLDEQGLGDEVRVERGL